MSQLPEEYPIETQDIVVLIAKTVTSIREAKEDDGKISMPESIGIGASITPAVLRAVKGFGEIPREFRNLGENEIDMLYNDFLVRIGWNPDEHTRELYTVCYRMARALIVGASELNNILNIPKAIPV